MIKQDVIDGLDGLTVFSKEFSNEGYFEITKAELAAQGVSNSSLCLWVTAIHIETGLKVQSTIDKFRFTKRQFKKRK